MLVRAYVARFRCVNPICREFRLYIRQTATQDVVLIPEIVGKWSNCVKCRSNMSLDRIDCKLIEVEYRKFGNPMKGHWACKVHPDHQYFPIPMQNAMENLNNGVEDESDMSRKYTKIILSDYPWRCPLCGNYLRYFTNTEVYCGYG
jgi:hypothetical protein